MPIPVGEDHGSIAHGLLAASPCLIPAISGMCSGRRAREAATLDPRVLPSIRVGNTEAGGPEI